MVASIVRFWGATYLMMLIGMGSLHAGTVPRYGLKPGQVLTYEENQSFKAQRFSYEYRVTRRFWIVGQNDDGSWRVVGREIARNSRVPSDMIDHCRFDLRPNGEVLHCETLSERMRPSLVFPRLPQDKQELGAGWEAHDGRDDGTIRYTLLGGKRTKDGAIFEFHGVWDTYAEKIYEQEDNHDFHFDHEKKLVVRAESVRSVGAHTQGKGTGTLVLESVEEMGPAKWMAMRDEVDRCFAAYQAYLALCRKAETSGNAAEALLEQARALLADARAGVKLPEAAALLDDRLEGHDKDAKRLVDQAKRLAKVIGRPAPAWEIEDLGGQTHRLEEYRGKVLVLDFWYRGCGWCMQAMPQVKRVAAHYPGRPVAVFGISSDEDVNDAKFVVRKMQLDYPVLHSQELPRRYEVQGFPTLIIIDQQGKVADIHVGYSRRLYEDVTKAIDHLLEVK
jgi:peroxiredoxin